MCGEIEKDMSIEIQNLSRTSLIEIDYFILFVDCD